MSLLASTVSAGTLRRDLLESRARFAAARAAFAAHRAARSARPAGASPTASEPRPGLADWQGEGVPVSTNTVGQGSPQICSDGSGGAYVGWWDLRNGFGEVFMNRLDGNGAYATGWPTDGANLDPTDSLELFVEVAADGGGGAFGVFSHFDADSGVFHDIVVQHMTGAGVRAPLFPAGGRSLGVGQINGFGLSADGVGGLFLIYADAADDVHFLHLDGSADVVAGWPSSGFGLGPASPFSADVAPDGTGGGFMLRTTGRAYVTAADDTILCRRFAADGGTAAGWPATDVHLTTGSATVGAVAAATLSSGDLMVTWVDDRNGDPDLFAVRVGANGSFPAPWGIGGVPVNTVTGVIDLPLVLPDGSGGAVIGWSDMTTAGGLAAPAAQHLDAAGAIVAGWPANGLLLCPPSADKSDAPMIADGQGGVFAVWALMPPAANPGIYAQHVRSDGTRPPAFPAGGVQVCGAATNKYSPVVTLDAAGGAILAWEDLRAPAPRVYAARVLLDGTVPAELALVDAATVGDRVRLHWVDPAGEFSATLTRSSSGTPDLAIPVVSDGTGDLVWEDADVRAGHEYRYALRRAAGGPEVGAVTVRVPDAPRLAIESPRPTPSPGRTTLAFTLASAAPARLELLDVSGRLVLARALALSAGAHVLPLADALAPGVYVARLAQSGATVSTRIVVTR